MFEVPTLSGRSRRELGRLSGRVRSRKRGPNETVIELRADHGLLGEMSRCPPCDRPKERGRSKVFSKSGACVRFGPRSVVFARMVCGTAGHVVALARWGEGVPRPWGSLVLGVLGSSGGFGGGRPSGPAWCVCVCVQQQCRDVVGE